MDMTTGDEIVDDDGGDDKRVSTLIFSQFSLLFSHFALLLSILNDIILLHDEASSFLCTITM